MTDPKNSEEKFGNLPNLKIRIVRSKSKLVPIDGQHRVLALRGLLEAIESKNQQMAKSLMIVEPSLSPVRAWKKANRPPRQIPFKCKSKT